MNLELGSALRHATKQQRDGKSGRRLEVGRDNGVARAAKIRQAQLQELFSRTSEARESLCNNTGRQNFKYENVPSHYL